MTANVARIEDGPAPSREAEPADAANDTAPSGWDPYEVWRTRVLLPRLRERDSGRDVPEIGAVSGQLRRIGKA